jgi:hypothetical protein
MDFEKYLSDNDPFWKDALSIGGGAALGVIGTRAIDRFASPRLHPLALFGLKCVFSLGVGSMAYAQGYEKLASGFVFGSFADSTIRYADQIEVRYLPGDPAAQ